MNFTEKHFRCNITKTNAEPKATLTIVHIKKAAQQSQLSWNVCVISNKDIHIVSRTCFPLWLINFWLSATEPLHFFYSLLLNRSSGGVRIHFYQCKKSNLKLTMDQGEWGSATTSTNSSNSLGPIQKNQCILAAYSCFISSLWIIHSNGLICSLIYNKRWRILQSFSFSFMVTLTTEAKNISLLRFFLHTASIPAITLSYFTVSNCSAGQIRDTLWHWSVKCDNLLINVLTEIAIPMLTESERKIKHKNLNTVSETKLYKPTLETLRWN